MGGTELDYVHQAFESNWIAPLGPNVEGFEASLESYLGEGTHVAALSSGTAALHLALVLLGVGTGDEVLCQSLTFAASANPIRYVGATPIFVDSEPDTWNMCPQQLERALEDRIRLGKKPRAIVAVHLYGMPYKVSEIHALAQKFEIPVLEDSAEALGSYYRGKPCGTFGDMAILSFNGNKIITTSGGGALVAPMKEVKQRAVFLATQARDAAPHYEHSTIGYNYRMSNISAGIGRGQMEVLDKHIGLRRETRNFYAELFEDHPGITVAKEPSEDYFSNFWLSCILVNETEAGFSIATMQQQMADAQIECRPMWKPMHRQPIFEDAPYYGTGVADTLFDTGLCLPSGSSLTPLDKQRIRSVLQDVMAKGLK